VDVQATKGGAREKTATLGVEKSMLIFEKRIVTAENVGWRVRLWRSLICETPRTQCHGSFDATHLRARCSLSSTVSHKAVWYRREYHRNEPVETSS